MSWLHFNTVPRKVERILGMHEFFKRNLKNNPQYDRDTLLEYGMRKWPQVGKTIAQYLLFHAVDELYGEAHHTN